MSKKERSPLEIYLRKKAKEFKSDWEDVPMWVIDEANKFIEASKPSETERQVSEAEHYLCDDDDMTTLQMIEAIANHEDQNDLIDNVEGVVVWEKVEYSITCRDFLEMIGY